MNIKSREFFIALLDFSAFVNVRFVLKKLLFETCFLNFYFSIKFLWKLRIIEFGLNISWFSLPFPATSWSVTSAPTRVNDPTGVTFAPERSPRIGTWQRTRSPITTSRSPGPPPPPAEDRHHQLPGQSRTGRRLGAICASPASGSKQTSRNTRRFTRNRSDWPPRSNEKILNQNAYFVKGEMRFKRFCYWWLPQKNPLKIPKTHN